MHERVPWNWKSRAGVLVQYAVIKEGGTFRALTNLGWGKLQLWRLRLEQQSTPYLTGRELFKQGVLCRRKGLERLALWQFRYAWKIERNVGSTVSPTLIRDQLAKAASFTVTATSPSDDKLPIAKTPWGGTQLLYNHT